MKFRAAYFICLLCGCFQGLLAQDGLDRFLTPSDSLQHAKRNIVVAAQVGTAAVSLAALHQMWYRDYPRSDFFVVNDNVDWLQMDKAGYVFAAYHLGNFSKDAFAWSGVSQERRVFYGALTGFGFLTTVEVLDGFSSNWGMSVADLGANAAGTSLFVFQELLWQEQRLVPKFSFHTTPYASARPSVLGNGLGSQLFNDYNGQTYWLSVNLHSFFKASALPSWLNVAVGYGAEGMITEKETLINTVFLPEKERVRQFYFSLDADLTKIRTKSHVLKTLFEIFNTVKIPAPTFEINGRGAIRLHGFYF